jgi:hypothetical protein
MVQAAQQKPAAVNIDNFLSMLSPLMPIHDRGTTAGNSALCAKAIIVIMGNALCF